MNKSIFGIFTLFFCLNTYAQSDFESLVLGEIQNTFVKDYQVSTIFWSKKKSLKKGKIKVQPVKKKLDWMSNQLTKESSWHKSSSKNLNSWSENKKKILRQWQAERVEYLKRIPGYKKNLIADYVFTATTSLPDTHINKKDQLLISSTGDQVIIIPNAFDLQVKDQGARPTCSAFASTRALEIALLQRGVKARLSDQYIYFSSKPNCQKSPCSKKGSWGLNAFLKSMRSSKADIPTEQACPYSKWPKAGNETQIPLIEGCLVGHHKLKSFSKVKTTGEILKALDAGHPVVSAFKLSANFYKNKGVILFKDKDQGAKMDSQAKGHAILLIGYMKLPLGLNEGRFCFLIANSWGTGWGKGGHACISERWLTNFRYNVPFLAVEKMI